MFPTISEFDIIIENLNQVDLSNDQSEKEVYSHLKRLINLPVVCYSLPQDFPITRARLNAENERFDNLSQVWHKPDKFNTDFGRASNTYFNILYGAISPFQENVTNKPAERITALSEVSRIYFNETSELQTEIVTFARFIPGKQLNLICPFDFGSYSDESALFMEMKNAFDKTIKEYPDYEYQITKFHSFIASQFKKFPIRDTFEYKLTALFTEIVLNLGFDGIMYPSVRTDLKGFNVAISSKFVEANFKLLAVCESTHYKRLKQSFLNNDLMTDVIQPNGDFTLSENHEYKCPEELIINQLNSLEG